MIKNNLIKRLGTGLMAGLCAFSMLGNIPNTPVTNAASTSQTESFPSADKVIAQAATLLGSPYGWGARQPGQAIHASLASSLTPSVTRDLLSLTGISGCRRYRTKSSYFLTFCSETNIPF